MTNVRDFGARGDGKADDTQAFLHAIVKGDGHVHVPRGDYVLTRTLPVSLSLQSRFCLDGSGGTAKLIMRGTGPALHLIGSHGRSADPTGFADAIWARERLPMVRDIEIVGDHAEADGVRIEGTMQSTLHGVLIRKCRNAVHITNRARNVLIADCHIYDNSGIGIFLDRLNLHQIIINSNHISYCKRGGLVVAGSEIRNIQIVGNDIEYNHDLEATESHDILFDCRQGTVREGTLVGNTVQARGTPGGANLRFLGAKDHPNAVGLFSITGNLLGSQTKVIDLHACRGVVISGNHIYSGYRYSLWAEDSENLVFSGNSIDHNPEYRGNSTDQMVLRRCRNVAVNGLIMQHTLPPTEQVGSSIEVEGCRDVSFTGMQLVNARVRGIALANSTLVRVADCTIRGSANDVGYRAAVHVNGDCRQVMVMNNFLGRGSDGDFRLGGDQGQASGNIMI